MLEPHPELSGRHADNVVFRLVVPMGAPEHVVPYVLFTDPACPPGGLLGGDEPQQLPLPRRAVKRAAVKDPFHKGIAVGLRR